jgi:hypothetical protein
MQQCCRFPLRWAAAAWGASALAVHAPDRALHCCSPSWALWPQLCAPVRQAHSKRPGAAPAPPKLPTAPQRTSSSRLRRVHCLVGDYNTALKAMYPLNLFDRASLYTPKIPLCNITLYYYSGFCYVMMRRCACARAHRAMDRATAGRRRCFCLQRPCLLRQCRSASAAWRPGTTSPLHRPAPRPACAGTTTQRAP